MNTVQYDSLVKKIYDRFMDMPNMGMGEMAEANEEAKIIVDEWMHENKITLEKPDERVFFWKDLSGRGFTNTFTLPELLESFRLYIPDEDPENLCSDEDEENIKDWAENCNEGAEYHRDANLITRIK